LRRFLHQAHVFGSAVQEVLEEKYLREASDLAISVAQFRLLKLIALGGVHQVGEVAEFLGVSSPAAVKSIDKLEAMGLVTRLASADDRRVTLLVATGHGHGLVRDYEDTKARQLGPVLELVGPEQVEQLTGLLERFSTLLFGNQTVETRSCLRCAAYGDETCTLNAGDCPYKGGRGSSAAAPASLQEGER
jgi:DNA-binding MarR family transcriptional regulator